MNEKPDSKKLARLRELVTCNPEIMFGIPVFKGTRIPVDLVADMIAQGANGKEILEGYPTLSEEMLSLAPFYVNEFGPGSRTNRTP